MSRHPSQDHAVATDVLEVLREEQCSPARSSVNMNAPKVAEEGFVEPCTDCTCLEKDEKLKEKMDPDLVQTLLHEKEKRLTADFQERLQKDITFVKERCDFILQNEQIRASYMLREAHRERQEKISALQTQLECKNLAGLMFVMCSERRKSKLERMRIVAEFTTYIHALQDILTEAQTLILHLSKGYRTAARVDHEWRGKMRKVITEFQMFVHDFAGGSPETNQYFFDVPALLKTEASIVDNPSEDPCEPEEDETEEDVTENCEKPWWERMDSDCRPFLMFGDMAEFKPPQRREVLHTVKAAKTAPRKWKEYVFNEMFLKAECENADVIKDEYPNRLPIDKWECENQHADKESSRTSLGMASRRATRASEEIRGNMGSILKIMTSQNTQPAVTKSTLLGARDSMEIASTTKLRERHKTSDHGKVVINVGDNHQRRTSFFDEQLVDFADTPDISRSETKEDDEVEPDVATLGSTLIDSLDLIKAHVPEPDHKIYYEKVCPMEKCQRMQVDSFVRSLPPYMRSNPYTHFEQNYEQYEPCSPEQLAILQQRIEKSKKKKEALSSHEMAHESPLAEWTPSVEGVAVQTSELSTSLPTCTCRVPSPTPVSSNGVMFTVADLFPVKEALDQINKECLFDGGIQFNRFKVIGQESNASMKNKPKPNFADNNKVYEITKILQEHPSLTDIFQANARC